MTFLLAPELRPWTLCESEPRISFSFLLYEVNGLTFGFLGAFCPTSFGTRNLRSLSQNGAGYWFGRG